LIGKRQCALGRLFIARFIDTRRVADWVQQFDPADRPTATRLVEAITLVNLDYFFSGVRTRALQEAATARGPVGLYVEREIRKWRGEPNRLFKEKKRRGRITAYGAGPRPVQPARTINPEVGSEGLLAWLATEICREHPTQFISHPGPDQIRAEHISTFLLLTDFIGSGRRASTYLSAAWRVASVRSWHSGGFLRFRVVAYSGTEEGCRVVSRHQASPRLSLVTPCPTIRSTFNVTEAATIEAICLRYDPDGPDPVESLGYAGTGALIVFAHGCPNNAPRLLHRGRPGRWTPIFPERVTAGSRATFAAHRTYNDTTERLQSMGQQRLAESVRLSALPDDGKAMVLLLAALARGPRLDEAVASRTGLTLVEVEHLLRTAVIFGWIDHRRRLTDAGHGQLEHVRTRPRSNAALLPEEDMSYFPRSLRAR
jgi:hypothetical protein